jgi:hypothetical protein
MRILKDPTIPGTRRSTRRIGVSIESADRIGDHYLPTLINVNVITYVCLFLFVLLAGKYE